MTKSRKSSIVAPKTRYFYIILALLVILAYGSALFNSLVIDDQYVLLNNTAVKSLKNLPSFFTRNYFALFAEQSYRPVVSISYMLDYILWGMRLPGYHLHNLFLHILNVLLVFAVLSRILGEKFPAKASSHFIAFATAAFFAVHTISGEAVNVISFREDLQVVFFLLLSLWCFVKILTDGNLFHRYVLWVSCFLAVLSKENGAILPLLIVGAGLILRGRRFYRGHETTCLGAAAAFLFSILIRFAIMPNSVDGTELLILQGTFFQKGIRIIAIQGIYLQSLFYLRPFLPDMAGVISPGTMNMDFIYGLLSIVLLFIWVLILRRRSAWMALLFYALAMIPASNIFMMLNNPAAFRYIYFPALGLYFLVALSIDIIREIYKISGRALWIILFLLLAPAALYSNLWSRHWKDDETLWKYQVSHTPEYYKPWAELAAEQNNRGLYAEAENAAIKSLSLKPDYFYSWSALGFSQLYQGSHDEALKSFEKALEFPSALSGRAEIFFGMGYAFEQAGQLPKADQYYQKAVQSDPRHWGALTNLAILSAKKGELDKAQSLLEKVIEINPGDAESYLNLALVLLQKGEREKARALLIKAQKIDPQNTRIKNLLARLQ
jgi:tetratricopeptide (TPR) repeat protein